MTKSKTKIKQDKNLENLSNIELKIKFKFFDFFFEKSFFKKFKFTKL